MRTNIFNVLTLLALSAVVSCQKEELNDEENNSGRMSDIILRAEIDNEEADKGKTHLERDGENNYSVVWDALDEIVVVDSNNASAKYVVKGNGGTTSASFEVVQGSGTIDEDGTSYKAYSPSTLMVDNQLVWPSEQSYVAVQGSTTRLQGVSNAPMFAKNTGTLKDTFKFMNIGGLLRLTLKGGDGAKVKSIKVSTNNGEKLSGPFTIEYIEVDVNGQRHSYPKAVIDPIKGKNSIVLNMPDGGVTLDNGDSGVPFYFAVAACAYHELTFEVSTDKGVMRMTAKRTDGIVATRSSIITLPKTVKTSDWRQEFEWIDLGLPSGRHWANMNIGATSETDYGDYYFWGLIPGEEPYIEVDASGNVTKHDEHNIVSNSGNWDKYTSISNKEVDLIGDNRVYDIAYLVSGIGHLPSMDDWRELVSNTTVTSETINSVSCLKFTNKNNPDEFIYLPKGGRYNGGVTIYNRGSYTEYLSSTHKSSHAVHYFYYKSNGDPVSDYDRQSVAMPVRAIKYADPVVPADVEYIDLGVEVDGKKILWADRNIGATSSTEAGWYLIWGAPEIMYTNLSNGGTFTFMGAAPDTYVNTYWYYGRSMSVGFSIACSPYSTGSSPFTKYNSTDKKVEVEPIDDVVARTWGNGWRTPSITELEAMGAQCVWIAETVIKSGTTTLLGYYVFKAKEEAHKGYHKNGNGKNFKWNSTAHFDSDNFTSDFSGNYDPDTDICIYLPMTRAASGTTVGNYNYGLYWSRNRNENDNSNSYGLGITTDHTYTSDTPRVRHYGGQIRPVFVVE